MGSKTIKKIIIKMDTDIILGEKNFKKKKRKKKYERKEEGDTNIILGTKISFQGDQFLKWIDF